MNYAIEKPIIEFRRVTKSFGAQRVLHDIDLKIERGRTTVIIGRSGTGKSVLLKHIVGLLKPDKGEVYFDGVRIDALSERALVPIRQRISFVFQLNALFDSLTVAENIAFPLTQAGSQRHEPEFVDQRVERCLDIVGLKTLQTKRPADLSGGERKRVALARAIAIEPPPDVILYDEPTAGLDPQRSDAITKLIQHMREEVNVTGVVVTHDMKLASEVGDRIVMLYDGRFIADGPPEELSKARDEHVRRFIHGEAEPHDVATLSV